MKTFTNKKQHGFSILAIILVIVAVVVCVGLWALSGQTNLSNNANNSLDISIQGFLNDSLSIKSNFDAYAIQNGSSTANNVDNGSFTYDKPNINTNLVRSGASVYEGKWIINPSNFYGSNVGTNGGADIALIAGGITDIACQQINYRINNTTTVPVVTSSNTSSDVVKTFSSQPNFNYTYIYLPSVAGLSGWLRGCFNVKNIPDNNVFFSILYPQ